MTGAAAESDNCGWGWRAAWRHSSATMEVQKASGPFLGLRQKPMKVGDRQMRAKASVSRSSR